MYSVRSIREVDFISCDSACRWNAASIALTKHKNENEFEKFDFAAHVDNELIC